MSTTISAGKWRSEVQKMADRARDGGDYLAAAELYEKVIALGGHASIAMAAGHMRKEAKDFVAAERHYQNVREANPDDPEIYMQLGHFYKTVGRFSDAQRYYMLAMKNHYANFDEVKHELRAIHESEELSREQRRSDSLEGAGFKGLVSERLFPRRLDQLQREYGETLVISRLGNHRKTISGKGRVIRGVDAIRGHIITSIPCDIIDIFLNDELIYSAPLQVVPLRWEKNKSNLRKYVFNAWIDFSDVPVGNCEIVLCANPLQGEPREGIEWQREKIIIAERLQEGYDEQSPALIPALDSETSLTVAEQVNRLPSLVRKVTPGSFPGKLDTIAIIRPDQLGDMVITLPAIRRIRELAPKSRIVGLLSPANADLAA
ncbi:tetratricopeptide repeat protein, partial [Gluconobacter wancherniae]|uniref:tetratricopeptide repeat protein n=1 Tax=Gluconobacter wancherniae TaxID=1307955 RepID=UPI00309EA393